MGCLDEETVLALVEGTLADDDRARADRHLARCSECRTLVARAAEALLSTGAVDDALGGDASAPPRAPRPGDNLGRYRVTELLGAGAMGIVVAAHDAELGREVALKLLRGNASRDVRERFVREARAASAIAHPGVVAIHDVLTTADGHPVIVMDRLHGETLRERLERERVLGVAAALEVASAIAAALEAAHARGVVHRDLKPENVFLARREGGFELKLLDFGVAKLIESPLSEGAELTATGTIVGTPYYMAPEQAFGQRDVDARADLWSLGVILYECLSGRRPFSADSVGQVLRLLALGELTPLSEVAPEVPDQVVLLVKRLLSERDKRPASATEVRRTITDLASAQPMPRRAPSSRKRWLMAGALAIGVLGIAAWGFGERDAAQREQEPLAAQSSFESAVPPRVLSVARAEPARAESTSAPVAAPPLAAPTARRPSSPVVASAASAAPAPSASSAKSGPGKLLTEPLF